MKREKYMDTYTTKMERKLSEYYSIGGTKQRHTSKVNVCPRKSS